MRLLAFEELVLFVSQLGVEDHGTVVMDRPHHGFIDPYKFISGKAEGSRVY